jgi:hydrogenase maturation factor HypF (carbamoyltransferase family)
MTSKIDSKALSNFITTPTLEPLPQPALPVCLSGGTFHNVYLSERLEARLSEVGFEVFTQKEVPSGDGGLSLGQALAAAATLHTS